MKVDKKDRSLVARIAGNIAAAIVGERTKVASLAVALAVEVLAEVDRRVALGEEVNR